MNIEQIGIGLLCVSQDDRAGRCGRDRQGVVMSESEAVPKPDVPDVWPAGSETLKAAGFYDQDAVADSAFARILLLGAPGTGKTTSILTTAPGPIAHINCDGDSATKEAARQGAKYFTLDVGLTGTRKAWQKARTAVEKAVAAGEVKTVVLDSISMLADNLYDEISLTAEGFDLWNELNSELSKLKRLFALEAHVFVIGHITTPYKKDDPEAEGIMPLIGGKSKVLIPSYAQDRVLFDWVSGRNPERMFLLGPQGNWSYGCRRANRKMAIAADVTKALFPALGITP